MSENKLQDHSQNKMIQIEIDNELYTIPIGYTLATAITYAKGINYRKTRFGDERGPVCNMGVCFECSIFLKGEGNVRACMIKAKDGMVVHTMPDFEQLTEEETHKEETVNSEGEMRFYDVVIIGSGPAGLAAAEELLDDEKLQVAIIDEQKNAGGQIYRHIPKEINDSKPNELVKRMNKHQSQHLQWIQGGTVWSIVPYKEDGNISSSIKEQDRYHIFLENHAKISAHQIIIATGAYDYVTPFKGWTKPGVMSAGGLQLFAKTQHFLPGKDVLLAGSHPFILIVAKQILDNGGTVKGIAFSQQFPQLTELFEYGIHSLKRWKKSKELLEAFKKIRNEKVPIWFNTIPIEAEGMHKINQIKLAKLDKDRNIVTGSEFNITCDTAGMCYGFNASSELPRQMNCDTYVDNVHGGHLVVVDDNMETSKKGVYAAGELTGIGGAELSEIEGRIAGLALLRTLRPSSFSKYTSKFNQLKKERKAWLSFAEMLGKATKADVNVSQLLKDEPQTYVCRCEEVTFESLEILLEKNPHLTSLNAIKLMSRCGMGLCQGRYCERTLSTIAEEKIGEKFVQDNFSTRFPIKPVSIKHIVNKK